MNSLQHTLRASLVFGGGAALLLLLFFIHIGQGQANISYSMIIDALISPNQSLEHQTLIMLRLPRAVIVILGWRRSCCIRGYFTNVNEKSTC